MDKGFTDNTAQRRYELAVDGHTAYADYRRDGATVFINYVFAPEELRGTGAAGRLMQDIVERARGEDLKIVPICGYAVAWLRKHPEYKDLIP
jgi:predicted GNAT family acetyltransferase